ncbi:hypothetical protein AURDEDRAFT_115387 [Auricularia subglabra TFB-10046 SS5]|nr:hypothetical protein AURDEDRAFT_115387 [Auricularia subglabra TFB-10046 SS5]
MAPSTASRPNQRLKLAAGLSLLPFFLFLVITSGYSAGQAPDVRELEPESRIENSIIIPSYHEAPNITPLVTRIFQAVESPDNTEVVIVDDNSRDGTAEAVEQLKNEGYNVVIFIRTDESGLSGAVLRGFKEARGRKFVVMDADLQHPPESIPTFLRALTDTTPFAMGTRYGPGGGVDRDWPLYRRIISAGARSLARPLTSASDPMSGFFGLTRELYRKSAPVNPVGFKIALELLQKTRVPRNAIAEVPFGFSKRVAGESKLSSKVVVRYVMHLAALYRWRMGLFGLLLFESALVGVCWLALHGFELVRVYWHRRQRSHRQREKFKLDV